eukprot:scaffold678669_cov61-Prasinocladus_malaysianus.AAC.1
MFTHIYNENCIKFGANLDPCFLQLAFVLSQLAQRRRRLCRFCMDFRHILSAHARTSSPVSDCTNAMSSLPPIKARANGFQPIFVPPGMCGGIPRLRAGRRVLP